MTAAAVRSTRFTQITSHPCCKTVSTCSFWADWLDRASEVQVDLDAPALFLRPGQLLQLLDHGGDKGVFLLISATPMRTVGVFRSFPQPASSASTRQHHGRCRQDGFS